MLLNKKIFAVIEEFCADYDKKVYGRNIAKNLGLNQKTASNILKRLEEEDILKFSQEGRNKYYFLNRFNPNIKEIIKIIEAERKIRFIEVNRRFRELFNKLEQRAEGMLIIFGSYAKGIATVKSDLDIFVIGKIKDISDLEGLYNIKINVVKSERKKFDKKEHLVQEIIKNHIILKGAEEFIELVW